MAKKFSLTKGRRLSILLLLVPATISLAFAPPARSYFAVAEQASTCTSSSSTSINLNQQPTMPKTTGMPQWFQHEISITAPSRGCHLITSEVNQAISSDMSNVKIGMANLFIQHTSASLTINENADPNVRRWDVLLCFIIIRLLFAMSLNHFYINMVHT